MPLFPTNEIKKQINSLVCPMCKCSLEGTPMLLSDGHTEEITLCCSQGPYGNLRYRNHYVTWYRWDLDKTPIVLLKFNESLTFKIERNEYSILKSWSDKEYISIHAYKINNEGIRNTNIPYKSFHYYELNDPIFEFKDFDAKKLAEKIETIFFYS